MAIKIITRDGAISEFLPLVIHSDADTADLLQYGTRVAQRLTNESHRNGLKLTFVLDEIVERTTGIDLTLIVVDAHYEAAINEASKNCRSRIEGTIENIDQILKDGA